MRERKGWGEGQVIFRYPLQWQQRQGASVPIEVSAPLGSALPPARLCGWAGPTAPSVNHSLTDWAGQKLSEDERLLSWQPSEHLSVFRDIFMVRV